MNKKTPHFLMSKRFAYAIAFPAETEEREKGAAICAESSSPIAARLRLLGILNAESVFERPAPRETLRRRDKDARFRTLLERV